MRTQHQTLAQSSIAPTLDAFPAVLVIITLIICVVGALLVPEVILASGAAFAGYSALRFVIASVANVYGRRRIRQDLQVDWVARYQAERTLQSLAWEQVQHVVIMPNYAETDETLIASLENLAQVDFAREQMIIVLAMESREADCIAKAKRLQAQFAGCFAHIFYTLHPDGLPGEMRCKSANQAWAARWIKHELVDLHGYNLDHIIVTTMDADTIWHPRYFHALTYHFAIEQSRHQRIWQAPLRYHSNIYRINPLMRISNAYATAFELAYLAAPHWLTLPMSSYSLSLRMLDSHGYWDTDVIADEWHTYIKAYFASNGQFKIVPIYLPFLVTAVNGKTLRESIRNRYRQSLRHAWGTKEMTYTLLQMWQNPHTPLSRGMRLFMRVSHDILHAGVGWVFLTVGTQLPILLHPHLLDGGLLYPPFLIMNISFFLVFWLGVVFWWLDVDVRPKANHRKVSREEWLYMLFSPVVLPLIALVFVSLPVLHAQFRLMIGHGLTFHVTQKDH